MENGSGLARGNTPGNITNGGLMAQQDQWLYFKGLFGGTHYLLKKNLSSGEIIKVSDDRANYINIVGEWIYYTTGKENYSIVKIRTDGTERTILADDKAEYMNVVGDRIYYANFSSYAKLYTMRVDGTDRGKVYKYSDEVSLWVNAFSDWIYYANLFGDPDDYKEFSEEDIEQLMMTRGIYKIRPGGSNSIQLNNYDADYINVSNEWIYFTNTDDADRIYKMKNDGNEQQALTEEGATNLNVSGDFIYYCNKTDKGRIYRIQLDGSEQKCLSEKYASCIYIFGEWVYYPDWEGNLRRMQSDGSDNQLIY